MTTPARAVRNRRRERECEAVRKSNASQQSARNVLVELPFKLKTTLPPSMGLKYLSRTHHMHVRMEVQLQNTTPCTCHNRFFRCPLHTCTFLPICTTYAQNTRARAQKHSKMPSCLLVVTHNATSLLFRRVSFEEPLPKGLDT